MSRRTLLVESRSLVVALDDPPPVAERWSALAVGRLLDEETGRLATAAARGHADRTGISVRASGDGTFSLVARPWLASPPLLAPSYDVRVTLEVDGYLPLEVEVTVPTNQRLIAAPVPVVGSPLLTLNTTSGIEPGQLLAIGPPAFEERVRVRHLGPGPQQVTLEGGLGMPHGLGDPVVADAWTHIDLGAIALHRLPVVLRGRTVRRDPTTHAIVVVPNATVTLTNFWTTLAAVRALLPGSMTDPNPATRSFLATLSPGLVAARAVGPGQMGRQDLTLVAGSDRFLMSAVAAGDLTCRISDRQALGGASVLRVDPDDPELSEAVTLSAVTGLGPPDQAGDVTLVLPCARAHRPGARVVRVLPQPAVPAVPLRREARPGDRSVFVSDLSTLPDDVDVRLSGGTPPIERQHFRRYETQSDADGYFALPPLHRVAALTLHVTAGLLTPVDLTVHPQYGLTENWLDVVFA